MFFYQQLKGMLWKQVYSPSGLIGQPKYDSSGSSRLSSGWRLLDAAAAEPPPALTSCFYNNLIIILFLKAFWFFLVCYLREPQVFYTLFHALLNLPIRVLQVSLRNMFYLSANAQTYLTAVVRTRWIFRDHAVLDSVSQFCHPDRGSCLLRFMKIDSLLLLGNISPSDNVLTTFLGIRNLVAGVWSRPSLPSLFLSKRFFNYGVSGVFLESHIEPIITTGPSYLP